MKANEFVKKFGWDSAKSIINKMPESATSYRASENNKLGLGGLYGRINNENGGVISLEDLKRIVESHELVKKHNGLESAKHDLYTAKKVGMYIVWGTPIDLLKQAIADVESCQ